MDPKSLNTVGGFPASSDQAEDPDNQTANSVKPKQSRPVPLWNVLNDDTDFSVLPLSDSGTNSPNPSAPLSPSFATQPSSPSGFPTRNILQPRGPAKDGRKRKRSRLTADLMPFDSVDYWLEFDNDNLTARGSAPANPDDDIADINFSESQPPEGADTQTAAQRNSMSQRQPMSQPVRSSNPMKVRDILDDTALENALSDEDNDYDSMNLASQLSGINSMLPSEIPNEDLYSTPLSWERPQMGMQFDSSIGWPTSTLTPEERQRLIAIAMNPGSMRGLGYNLDTSYGLGGGFGTGFGGYEPTAAATSWLDDDAINISETKSPAQSGSKPKDRDKAKDSGKEGKGQPGANGKATDCVKPKPGDRSAHNDIERKYRMNLKDRIAELRDAVPSLRTMPGEGGDDDDEEGASQPSRAPKASKGTVLTKAIEYIHHLEKKNRAISQQHRQSSRRIQAFEQLLSASAARPVFQMPTYSRALFDPRAFC